MLLFSSCTLTLVNEEFIKFLTELNEILVTKYMSIPLPKQVYQGRFYWFHLLVICSKGVIHGVFCKNQCDFPVCGGNIKDESSREDTVLYHQPLLFVRNAERVSVNVKQFKNSNCK